MKAAFLEKPGKLNIKEIEEPACGNDEVTVHIKATGVCGSDLHYFKEGRVGTNVVKGPHILGHESAGEIVEVGKNVLSLTVGDRVTIEPGVPCLRCGFCLSGRYNLCNDIHFLGAPPYHGTFREYVAHHSLFVHKLPENVSFQEGAFVEPLSVGYNAIKKAGVSPGESVLIIGAGTIGLSCLQMVKNAGAGFTAISDIDEYRLLIAKKLGADKAILAKKEKIEPLSYDCVIEATGAGESYAIAVEAIKKGGRIVVVGMSNTPASFDFMSLLRKEAPLFTVYRYANCYKPVLNLLEAEKINVGEMVSHVFSLDDIEKAFLTAEDPSENKMKILVE
jgi:L-iditol 2-dehydrogenase